MFKRGFNVIPYPYRDVVRKLVEELESFFGSSLVSVAVFGSVARGNPRKDSDVDVLIVVEDLPKSRFERLALYLEVEKKLDPLLEELLNEGYAITISPLLKTRSEASRVSPIYLDMVEDAVLVYDKGGFLEGILNHVIEVMKRLGSRRVWIGRKWYWVLKEDLKFGEVISIE